MQCSLPSLKGAKRAWRPGIKPPADALREIPCIHPPALPVIPQPERGVFRRSGSRTRGFPPSCDLNKWFFAAPQPGRGVFRRPATRTRGFPPSHNQNEWFPTDLLPDRGVSRRPPTSSRGLPPAPSPNGRILTNQAVRVVSHRISPTFTGPYPSQHTLPSITTTLHTPVPRATLVLVDRIP